MAELLLFFGSELLFDFFADITSPLGHETKLPGSIASLIKRVTCDQRKILPDHCTRNFRESQLGNSQMKMIGFVSSE
jgi:hypothetical protein